MTDATLLMYGDVRISVICTENASTLTDPTGSVGNVQSIMARDVRTAPRVVLTMQRIVKKATRMVNWDAEPGIQRGISSFISRGSVTGRLRRRDNGELLAGPRGSSIGALYPVSRASIGGRGRQAETTRSNDALNGDKIE